MHDELSYYVATYENFIGKYYNFRYYVKEKVMCIHTSLGITLKHFNDTKIKKTGCVNEFLKNLDVLYYNNKRKALN